MLAAAPPAVVATAPAESPLTLEAAFVSARAAARTAASPTGTLSGDGPAEDKLTAIAIIHSRIPNEAKAQKISDLNALAAAAASARQPPEVRAKALTYLGYAMPLVDDDAARTRALNTLLAALQEPAYRIFALRGLGPACHGLPESAEKPYLDGILGLLDGPVAGEERETALTALFAFVTSNADLSKANPALVAELDARVLAPVEADPAGFVADRRLTAGSRSLVVAAIYMSARHRAELGDPKPLARAAAVFDRLLAVEKDAEVAGWIKTYRDAPPPKPEKGLTARTTRRTPGPDEP